MIKKFLIIFFFILLANSNANDKEKILEKLNLTESLVFEFEQSINGKSELGQCILKYPKKIFCKYKKNNKL